MYVFDRVDMVMIFVETDPDRVSLFDLLNLLV